MGGRAALGGTYVDRFGRVRSKPSQTFYGDDGQVVHGQDAIRAECVHIDALQADPRAWRVHGRELVVAVRGRQRSRGRESHRGRAGHRRSAATRAGPDDDLDADQEAPPGCERCDREVCWSVQVGAWLCRRCYEQAVAG